MTTENTNRKPVLDVKRDMTTVNTNNKPVFRYKNRYDYLFSICRCKRIKNIKRELSSIQILIHHFSPMRIRIHALPSLQHSALKSAVSAFSPMRIRIRTEEGPIKEDPDPKHRSN
jgi:hypothetical protein